MTNAEIHQKQQAIVVQIAQLAAEFTALKHAIRTRSPSRLYALNGVDGHIRIGLQQMPKEAVPEPPPEPDPKTSFEKETDHG